ACAERAVARQVVAVIEYVERLRQRFEPYALAKPERAAQSRPDAEEIGARSRVSRYEHTVPHGPAGGALNGGDAGSNIQRQRRVVLQNSAQLKAMADLAPN